MVFPHHPYQKKGRDETGTWTPRGRSGLVMLVLLGSCYWSFIKFSHKVNRMLAVSGRMVSFPLPQFWVILGGLGLSIQIQNDGFWNVFSPHKLHLPTFQTMTCFYTTPPEKKKKVENTILQLPARYCTPPKKKIHPVPYICHVYASTSQDTGKLRAIFADKNGV